MSGIDDRERAEVEAARAEWQRNGGMEAHEFYRPLKDEEETEPTSW